MRLVDGTTIIAKKFRITTGNIWVGDIKYFGEDEIPVYLEDGMNLSKDAIDSWAVIHRGKDEVSED